MGKQILVIGGGVIGLCAAYYCAKQGNRVIVIDLHAEQRDGCSFGNAGMIVPSHFVPMAAPSMVALGLKWMWNPESPFYIQPRFDRELISWGIKFWKAATPKRVESAIYLLRDLSIASRACFEELAMQMANPFQFEQRGLLMLCMNRHTLEEEARGAERANQLGIPAEVLNAKQTSEREPDVRMNVAGSVYFPKDCHLTPHLFMNHLKMECEALGVQFQWQSKAIDFVRVANRIEAVRTSTNRIEADEIILAGGVWSPQLTQKIGLKIPMQPGKGYSLTLSQPRRLPKICAILCEARVAVTPIGESLRFGGTMEISGLNDQINLRRVQGIIKAAKQYYPDFIDDDFRGIEPWYGLRPCSPDGLPYVGRTARCPNLIIAAGHAMMGVSLGPITGQLVASLVANKPSPIPIDLLSPDRYG